MKADNAELKQEIHQMKRRITLLEKAFDSILTSDDSKAIKHAHRDLARGQTVDLSQEEASLRLEVKLSKRAYRELSSLETATKSRKDNSAS